MKKGAFFFKLGLFLSVFFLLSKFCEHQKQGFSLWKIAPLTKEIARENESLLSTDTQNEIRELLKQEFRFLDSGGQCFAFISADEKYVLKFYRTHRRQLLFADFPLPKKILNLRKLQEQKKQVKLQRDIVSFRLAFNQLKQQSGLLYLQLSPCNLFSEPLYLVDKIGCKYKIDPNQYTFILQKKADLLIERVQFLMAKNQIEEAKALLEKVCHLIEYRSEKGIFDEDTRIHCNLGVLQNEVIFIDIGRFKMDERSKLFRNDLTKIVHPFLEQLEPYPELYSHLKNIINNYRS